MMMALSHNTIKKRQSALSHIQAFMEMNSMFLFGDHVVRASAISWVPVHFHFGAVCEQSRRLLSKILSGPDKSRASELNH